MELLQHAVVTLVALAAGAVVIRRVLGFAAPPAKPAGCAGCPAARAASGSTAGVSPRR